MKKSVFTTIGPAWIFAMSLIASGNGQAQQNYPSKPIRMIVPYGPGGSTDNVIRIYAQRMQESWGQPLINDYKPGGNTIIGSEALTKAPPDGYTMLLVANTHAINPQLSKLPYDPVNDFAPVTTICTSDFMLVVHPSVRAATLKDFIAYAKSHPGQLNYASPGAGGLGHLSGELFNSLAGVKSTHIPFKGGAPAATALVAGDVQFAFAQPINVLAQIKAGKLKPIAISGKNRLDALPDMPTFAEAGMPNFESTNWFGILMPAATPKDLIRKVSDELNRIQALADVKEKLGAQGLDPLPGTPEKFAALIKSDMEKFARIVRNANIRLEN